MSAIKTYTGIMFDPLVPQPELIKIEDIAHALSMLCRANGHIASFYSAGQHCINCAKEAAARGYSACVQLGCLLHDGDEINQIFEIDDDMLLNEFMVLMDTALTEDIPVLLHTPLFVFNSFQATQEEYIACFSRLSGMLTQEGECIW